MRTLFVLLVALSSSCGSSIECSKDTDCISSSEVCRYGSCVSSSSSGGSGSGGGGATTSSCGQLNSGQSLVRDQLLDSCDGQFHLKMQADGNLVLYRGDTSSPSNATWATGTYGKDGQKAAMQSDGNFVLSSASSVLWSSATSGNAGAFLRLENSGVLKVMTPSSVLWTATPGDVNAAGVNHGGGGSSSGGCTADSDCGRCRRCQRSNGSCVARLTC